MSRWSYSRITTYEKCPRAYRYKYIDREKEAFESIEAFMGSRVHNTIEWLYGDVAAGTLVEHAVRHYHESWKAEAHKTTVPIKVIREGEKADDYRAQGEAIIRRFFPRFMADTMKTLAIEQQVRMTIGGRYNYYGYIDRYARDSDGQPWIIDYKTAKHAPEEFIGKEAQQVEAYGLAILQDKPDLEAVNLMLDFVRHDRVLYGCIMRDDMERVERQLVSRIEAAEVQSYSTRVSPLCNWCGYNDRCEGPKKAKEPKGALPF